MDKEQLTSIVRVADKRAIYSRLKEIGYIDCKKDIELRYLSIDTLFKGKIVETDTYSDGSGKLNYQGGIFTQVMGYEQLEFVVISINDNKNTFPIDLFIWAKEIS